MARLFSIAKVMAPIILSAVMIGACSTPQSIYKDENFSGKGLFEHHFDATAEIVSTALTLSFCRCFEATKANSLPDCCSMV